VKGLGSALQAKILQGLEIRRSGEGRPHVHRAAALLKNAEEQWRRARPDLKRIVPAGDFRRGCELISDLSLVVEAPHVSEQATITPGSLLKVHLTDPAHFGATHLHATGTGRHYEQLQYLAIANGMTLDERGLHRGRKTLARKTEQEITRHSVCHSSNPSCGKERTRLCEPAQRRRGDQRQPVAARSGLALASASA
jgi:DNA polymerase (family 10)